jgi:hypothetical protein
MERAGFRVVDDREQVASDTVRLRLDQSHHGVGRDGRVDRVSAALQDLHARPRGQRLTGGDDAVCGRDARSADDNAHVLHPTFVRRHAAIDSSLTREQEGRRRLTRDRKARSAERYAVRRAPRSGGMRDDTQDHKPLHDGFGL